MKRKILTIAVAALMVVAIAGAAGAVASETSWRFYLLADDGAGAGSSPSMSIGVHPSALDGLDTTLPLQDSVCAFIEPPGNPLLRYASGVLADDNNLVYTRDIKSNTSPYSYPDHQKIWDLRVMANRDASAMPIRLQFKTVSTTSTTGNPLATVGGLPIFFELVMIDNRGVLGAPTNGTIWNIPIPTAASDTAFWSLDTALDTNGVVWGNLPLLKSSSPLDASSLRAQGYEMQFRMMVPEPSGMLALGGCLVGLAGLMRRRK